MRPLTSEERSALEQIAHAGSERADRVGRARALLAGAGGQPYTDAVRVADRRAGGRAMASASSSAAARRMLTVFVQKLKADG